MADLKANAVVLIASTGEDALVTLTAQNGHLPALIMMDLNMPRMNGIELLEILSAHTVWSHIPAIVLTTSDQEEERQKCLALSAAGYVVKPSDYGD
ncbi:MAG: response regulator, partial [Limnospira sp. PMC 737.11]|uniref:response regulator n=1 Tax=Limnospira sp. PMC 737.11 TaxID=2981095 RepID=UPI0028E177C8